MKYKMLIIVIGFLSISAYASESSKVYENILYEAVLTQVKSMYAVSPEYKDLTSEEKSSEATKMASRAAICHMKAMAAYKQSIQDAAFKIANKGGSYADAKMALNQAIATEGMAGGKREEAIMESLREAQEITMSCMQS